MISAITQSTSYRWWAFGAISIGTFASVVDHGSVIIALPSVAREFETDIPTVQWVVIGFALTISALLLPMGRLADLVGLKKIYILGSLVFILGAVLAGFSPNLTTLILSRILQGAGAAMTQGTGMAIVAATFPTNERGKAIGATMTTVGVGAIAGPALGGLLVDALGWRSVFFVNIPMVALGVTMGLAILDGSKESQRDRSGPAGAFDWGGAALSTGTLLLLLITITNGHRTGWTSPPIVASWVGFLGFLITFIWWELRNPSPMLDLRFFRLPTFSFGVAAAFLTFTGTSAVMFLTPFYLQRVLGYGPREAGLVVVPGAVCMALVGVISGRLSDRYGWRMFTMGGLGLIVCALFILSRLTVTSSIFLVIPGLILQSTGMGIFYSPNISSVLSAVTREKYGVVSAFMNLIRNAGNVTSVAIATAIVTATMATMGFEPSLDAVQPGGAAGVASAFTSGLRIAYLTMMGLMALALAISAFKFQPAGQNTTEAKLELEPR